MLSRKSFLTSTGALGGLFLFSRPSLSIPEAAPHLAPFMARPALGNSYWYIGHLLSVLIKATDTNNLFSLLKMTEVKGLEPPPHTHTREDEIFMVLDGSIEFSVGGKTYQATAGDSMFLPRNIQHAFKVLTDRAEVMILLTPGGFEQYFIEMSEPAPAMELPPPPAGAPDIARLIATSSRYGIRFPERPSGT